MVYGVIGVIIWTDNLEPLVAFYRDTLGLRPHSVHDEFVAFQFGEMRLNVGRHDGVHGRSNEPYRIMINLGTRDIHRLTKELQQKGVQFVRLPERERWGGYVATFQDPDGNLLQLLQPPQS